MTAYYERFYQSLYANRDRYMGLNDLLLEIKQDPNSFLGDEPTEKKVLSQVLALVEDKISEVKNQAVKWYVTCAINIRVLMIYPIQSRSTHQDHPRVSDGLCCRQTDRLLRGQGRGTERYRWSWYVLALDECYPCYSNCSALKTITSELPPEGKVATKACEKLTPKLLGQLSNVRVGLTEVPIPFSSLLAETV